MNRRVISFLVSKFSFSQYLKGNNHFNRCLSSANSSSITPLSFRRTIISSYLTNKGSQLMCTTTNTECIGGQPYTSISMIKNEIKKDIANNFKNYSSVKKSFINLVEKKSFNYQNQEQLIDILYCLSQYSQFLLPNSIMLDIYKVICQNMHLKSDQTMNKLLLFVLTADQSPSQSPIFLEFIKFYVRNDLEVLKYTYQIDFSKLSLYEGIEQFLGKLIYRGFLSRTPPYDRGINIIYPQRILKRLTSKQILRNSMMIKKINYFLFLAIKEYYQQNMKENLYHRNKLTLLQKFNSDFMQSLSHQIQYTHYENVNLRELYMKLYLTLPNTIQVQDTIQGNNQQEWYMKQCQKYKYKNVIYLYNLSIKHIQRLDHFKIQEIDEKIEVVIQFVQQVSENLKKILKMNQQEVMNLCLSIQEILKIMIVNSKDNKDIQSYSLLQKIVQRDLSPYLFWVHFDLFMQLFDSFNESIIFQNVLKHYEYYQILKLSQVQAVSQRLAPYLIQERHQSLKVIWGNLLKRILQIDYQIVSGRQMVQFLSVYTQFLQTLKHPIFSSNILINDEAFSLSETLRLFMMRYISDHHKQFSLKQFQFILQLLTQLPSEKVSSFDDQDNNYPYSIFQELRPYFNKIKLLISQDIRERVMKNY